jgi:hypothetical protein
MRRCAHCGNPTDARYRFCATCGADLGPQRQSSSTAPVASPVPYPDGATAPYVNAPESTQPYVNSPPNTTAPVMNAAAAPAGMTSPMVNAAAAPPGMTSPMVNSPQQQGMTAPVMNAAAAPPGMTSPMVNAAAAPAGMTAPMVNSPVPGMTAPMVASPPPPGMTAPMVASPQPGVTSPMVGPAPMVTAPVVSPPMVSSPAVASPPQQGATSPLVAPPSVTAPVVASPSTTAASVRSPSAPAPAWPAGAPAKKKSSAGPVLLLLGVLAAGGGVAAITFLGGGTGATSREDRVTDPLTASEPRAEVEPEPVAGVPPKPPEPARERPADIARAAVAGAAERAPANVRVFLDNGMEAPLTFRVGSEAEVEVPAGDRILLDVPAGRTRIAARAADAAVVDEVEVDLRAYAKYIFNPRAARSYELETRQYTNIEGLRASKPETRTLAGVVFFEAPADFLFEEFPDTITVQTWGSVGVVDRTRLETAGSSESGRTVRLLPREGKSPLRVVELGPHWIAIQPADDATPPLAEIYVLSGYAHEPNLRVDGATIGPLAPGGELRISLAEGRHTLEVLGFDGPHDKIDAKISVDYAYVWCPEGLVTVKANGTVIRGIALRPRRDDDVIVRLGDAREDVRRDILALGVRAKEEIAARSTYEKLAPRLEPAEGARVSDFDLWIAEGLVAAARGKLEEAVEHYGRVLKVDEDHIEALRLRGLLYARLGENEPAEMDLHRAVELDPSVEPSLKKTIDRVEAANAAARKKHEEEMRELEKEEKEDAEPKSSEDE